MKRQYLLYPLSFSHVSLNNRMLWPVSTITFFGEISIKIFTNKNWYQAAYRTRFTKVVLNCKHCFPWKNKIKIKTTCAVLVLIHSPGHPNAGWRAVACLPSVTLSPEFRPGKYSNFSKTYSLYTEDCKWCLTWWNQHHSF
jgi:hypothetical protein